MSARRWIAGAWAGLCLAGAAATLALNPESDTDRPEPPAEESPTAEAYAVDCREIADHIARYRAEAEREQPGALDPSAPTQHRAVVKDFAVPAECADELEDRGLKTR